MRNQQPFGRNLKEWRKARDLTQEELAQRTGYAASTIRKIEAGRLRPSRPFAEQLADVLQVPANERQHWLQNARDLHSPTGNGSELADGEADVTCPSDGGLPAPSSSLVGRMADVQAATQVLLRPMPQILTLVGPPGVGKTRLSIAIAIELQPHFADGVVFVPLSGVAELTDVVPTIVQALQLPPGLPGGVKLVERLKTYLHDKSLLLVLDNFEHLVATVPTIRDLLTVAPGLKVLVTSRVSLGLVDEQIQHVAPLTTPPIDAAPTLATIRVYPATDLLLQRLVTTVPELALPVEQCRALIAIARLLDGLPLALELAATQSRKFTAQLLLEHLQQHLAALAVDINDGTAPHTTLMATIAWSYHLLKADVQILFARLAVFVDSWTADAAQIVCDPEESLCSPVVDGLTTLLDHNLITLQPTGASTPRYAMLHTIRAYAQQRLAEHNDRATIKHQHLAYYAGLVDQAAEHYQTADEKRWLDRLEIEHRNLSTALHRASAQDDLAPALHMAGRLGRYWARRGYWEEGVEVLDNLLPRVADHMAQPYLEATLARMVLAQRIGGFLAAERWANAVLQLALALGDRVAEADAHVYLGAMAHAAADRPTAEAHLATSVTLYQASSNLPGLAAARYQQWRVAAHHAEIMVGLGYLEETAALNRQFGDLSGLGQVLNDLGAVRAEVEGRYAEARSLTEEGLALFRQLGDIWGTCYALRNLGEVLVALDDLPAAEALFRESLAIARRYQLVSSIGMAFRELGVLAWLADDFVAAQQLFIDALRISEPYGDHWGTAHGHCCLGHIAYRAGNCLTAGAQYLQSLVHLRQISLRMLMPLPLLGLSWVLAASEPLRAARLFGAASAALKAPDYRMGWFHSDRVVEAEIRAVLESLFTTEDTRAARAAGAASPLTAIVEEVLDEPYQREVAR